MTTCKRCLMNDDADPIIQFDEDGYCNYCTEALLRKPTTYFPNDEGQKKISQMVKDLKQEGAGKKYDCLMGISGGLDSSYLAYLGAEKWGLRIGAVHVDDGYDTEISKQNIEKLIDKTGIDLAVIKPDPEQFNNLTLAYMKAGVPNLAVPQDNVLAAFLYDFARRNNIRTFLSGSNFSLESILQRGNTWNNSDVVNIKDIHRRFGTMPIDKLKFISTIRKMLQSSIYGIKTVMPLNYVDYQRDKAFQELHDYCGFEYYGRKHLENHLTAFLQTYWLPQKFGVDKRTSHLSSMVISDQMTREEALRELGEPLYDESYLDTVMDMLCENMHLSREELNEIMEDEPHQHYDYKTDKLYQTLAKVGKAFLRN